MLGQLLKDEFLFVEHQVALGLDENENVVGG
jgi:hypothetical protein